jgi:4-hydroxy-2-oxoglutarate aldolase
VVGELGIPGVKYGMDFNGYFGGGSRLPLLPITGEIREEIERLLADVRN